MAEDEDDVGPAHLGRAVRLARTARGLKAREVAQRTGLSYPYLSQIERGVRAPSSRALRIIAEALDISTGELLAMAAEVDESQPDEADEGTPPANPPVLSSDSGAARSADAGPGPSADAPAREDIARLVQIANRLSSDDVVVLIDFARRLLR